MVSIHAEWLTTATAKKLAFSLLEYRYLVKRFSQWLALCIGKSEYEPVRRLLLPNLIEELGGSENAPSHLTLLDKTIGSCGIVGIAEYNPTEETRRIEAWFFSVFSEQPVYNGLCVLGPGTEEISSKFLDPLETGIKNAFSNITLNLEYFSVHQTEMEKKHSESIEQAILILDKISMEENGISLINEKYQWSRDAIEAHNSFWNHLKTATIK